MESDRIAAATPTADPEAALARACAALWIATLSLMTAFMGTPAPAHRYLLAGRIARNFTLLQAQACFAPGTRARFARLAARWQRQADRLGPRERPAAGPLARLKQLLR